MLRWCAFRRPTEDVLLKMMVRPTFRAGEKECNHNLVVIYRIFADLLGGSSGRVTNLLARPPPTAALVISILSSSGGYLHP